MKGVAFAAVFLCNVALAAFPLVDFDKMGKVGVAGSFAGLDLFNNASFDTETSTLLMRSSTGSLTPLASTNAGSTLR